MKALLVRVGIDLKFGHWNSPVNPDTGEFVYVPIPEEEEVYPGYEKTYKQFEVPCQNLGVNLPKQLFEYKSTHLDPDFSNLTYGDNRERGKPLKGLAEGDILAFYAGLKSIKSKQYKSGELVYALIGLYVVAEEPIHAEKIPRKDWHKNAHTRRTFDKTDIVVFATPGLSGRLEQCIPIGEYRGKFDDIRGEIDKNSTKTYRVTRKLLDEWGGLRVEDGWIQRSANLPRFCNPEKFYEWFKKKNIGLVAKNN